MTKITPTFLSGLYRVVYDSPSIQQANDVKQKKSLPTTKTPKRSTTTLNQRLKSRLSVLQDEELDNAAPLIVIQEILCWEFSDSISGHPEFDNIVKKITTDILSHEQLSKQLALFVQSFRKHGKV